MAKKTNAFKNQTYNPNGALKRLGTIDDFSGGLNTASASNSIKDNQLKELINFEIMGGGGLAKRPGTKLLPGTEQGLPPNFEVYSSSYYKEGGKNIYFILGKVFNSVFKVYTLDRFSLNWVEVKSIFKYIEINPTDSELFPAKPGTYEEVPLLNSDISSKDYIKGNFQLDNNILYWKILDNIYMYPINGAWQFEEDKPKIDSITGNPTYIPWTVNDTNKNTEHQVWISLPKYVISDTDLMNKGVNLFSKKPDNRISNLINKAGGFTGFSSFNVEDTDGKVITGTQNTEYLYIGEEKGAPNSKFPFNKVDGYDILIPKESYYYKWYDGEKKLPKWWGSDTFKAWLLWAGLDFKLNFKNLPDEKNLKDLTATPIDKWKGIFEDYNNKTVIIPAGYRIGGTNLADYKDFRGMCGNQVGKDFLNKPYHSNNTFDEYKNSMKQTIKFDWKEMRAWTGWDWTKGNIQDRHKLNINGYANFGNPVGYQTYNIDSSLNVLQGLIESKYDSDFFKNPEDNTETHEITFNMNTSSFINYSFYVDWVANGWEFDWYPLSGYYIYQTGSVDGIGRYWNVEKAVRPPRDDEVFMKTQVPYFKKTSIKYETPIDITVNNKTLDTINTSKKDTAFFKFDNNLDIGVQEFEAFITSVSGSTLDNPKLNVGKYKIDTLGKDIIFTWPELADGSEDSPLAQLTKNIKRHLHPVKGDELKLVYWDNVGFEVSYTRLSGLENKARLNVRFIGTVGFSDKEGTFYVDVGSKLSGVYVKGQNAFIGEDTVLKVIVEGSSIDEVINDDYFYSWNIIETSKLATYGNDNSPFQKFSLVPGEWINNDEKALTYNAVFPQGKLMTVFCYRSKYVSGDKYEGTGIVFKSDNTTDDAVRCRAELGLSLTAAVTEAQVFQWSLKEVSLDVKPFHKNSLISDDAYKIDNDMINTDFLIYNGLMLLYNKDKIWISDPYNFGYFPKSYVRQLDSEGGSVDRKIQTIKYYQNVLVVFTNKDIHVLRGTNPGISGDGAISISKINNNYGAIIKDSVINYGNKLLFVSEKGIYALVSIARSIDDNWNIKKIDDDIHNLIDYTAFPNAKAFLTRSSYIIAFNNVNLNGEQKNVWLVYKKTDKNESWTIWEGVVNDDISNLEVIETFNEIDDFKFIKKNGSIMTLGYTKVLGVSPDNPDIIGNYDNRIVVPGYLDEGIPIVSTFKTKNYSFGNPFNKKSYKKFHILADGLDENTAFKVGLYIDEIEVLNPNEYVLNNGIYELIDNQKAIGEVIGVPKISNTMLIDDSILSDTKTVYKSSFKTKGKGLATKISLIHEKDEPIQIVSVGFVYKLKKAK